jgi:hypothetical protein
MIKAALDVRLQGGVRFPTGGESPRAPAIYWQGQQIPVPTVTVRMKEDGSQDAQLPKLRESVCGAALP